MHIIVYTIVIFATIKTNHMKKQLFSILIITGLFTACNTTPKGDDAATTETQEVAAAAGSEYVTDNSASVVGFTGNGVGKNHPGTFRLTEGKITVTDGKVSAGSFTLSVTSLGLDEPAEMIQTKLKGHLLSADFFDAEKFATVKFDITSVEPYTGAADASVVEGANFTVSGNLTLKDSTKNVSFPANIAVTETELKAKANFNIDRTQWGMSYGNDKALKDKFISPEVNIRLDIKATK
jgi:polyisoprenoid-binding protein YceI